MGHDKYHVSLSAPYLRVLQFVWSIHRIDSYPLRFLKKGLEKQRIRPNELNISNMIEVDSIYFNLCF